jgi:DnaJ-class molecular chaperone
MNNYYEILQVRNFATDTEIKKSFKKLAVQFHPDKNGGGKDFEERFKEIANAYDILSDKDKKNNFDFKLTQETLKFKKTESETNKTHYSEQDQKKSAEVKVGKKVNNFSAFWIMVIIILILLLLSNYYYENKTTTGNSKADKELEKDESAKAPTTGEINFNN